MYVLYKENVYNYTINNLPLLLFTTYMMNYKELITKAYEEAAKQNQNTADSNQTTDNDSKKTDDAEEATYEEK